MVSVDAFSAFTSLSTATRDRKGMADNFDTFLTLLTTQLRHQNPLEPLDTNQFTQQLVQFSSVEQAIKTNKNLEALTEFAAASTILGAVSFIGKEVSIKGDTANYTNGAAQWHFTSPAASSSAEFVVLNAQGVEVYRETRPLNVGSAIFAWDGRTTSGQEAPPGEYRLSIQAQNAAGQSIAVSMSSAGIVNGVDLSGIEPVLIVNGQSITFNQVMSVRTPG